MKEIFDKKRSFGKKNLILTAVAAILIATMAVGVSVSWIEEVSQVEFNSDNGQQTPLHIGEKKLNSDIVMKNVNTTVDLKDYFYESGDMHLSPCYGDGDSFYFPVEGTGFRKGTKDDANVNYISATFRLSSENANTVYWFEKANASTPYISISDSNLQQYLRCSITVDGATTVYALNETGSYNTVGNVTNNGVTELGVVSGNGRSMDAYSYYDENAAITANNGLPLTSTPNGYLNLGSGNNLNGNTLFSVAAGTKKTVNVKIWLEYSGSNVLNVSVSDINIKLVSSWAKTRRIFVKDETVKQAGKSDVKWLSEDDNTLYWAIKSTLNDQNPKIYEATNYIDASDYISDDESQYYWIDVPAVYNNTQVVLFRAASWNTGSKSYVYSYGENQSVTINCSDYWETTFPDTFHSGVYTIYTSEFGTWEADARYVKIVNSCHYTFDNVTQFSQPFAYMWDSSTDIPGSEDRVVQNAVWPGTTMTKLAEKVTDYDVYVFYYNSIFDRIIFNDNFVPKSAAYQTEDIDLDQAKTQPDYYSGKYYDMATMKWYDDENAIPSNAAYCLRGDFYSSDEYYTDNNDSRFTITRMRNNPDNSNEVFCRIYIRYPNGTDDQGNKLYYKFKIMSTGSATGNTTWYGVPSNDDETHDHEINWAQLTTDNGNKDVMLHVETPAGKSHPGVYDVYFNTNNKKVYVKRVRAT